MDIKVYDEYVYTRQLGLNLADQRYSAYQMYEYIMSNFPSNPDTDYSHLKATPTTQVYSQYNYLLYPYPGLHELYESIKETFHECYSLFYKGNPPNEKFYIQSWMNVYCKGQCEFVSWHTHYPPEFESWHGFYCVDVEPDSFTTYRLFGRIPEIEDIVVPSRDNLIVIGRNDGDVHRSSEWNNPNKARITVAFDIVPMSKLYDRRNFEKNHWIPI